MISDWITSFSMWQTLIAASTATTVPSLPLPREGAAAVLLPPRRLGVLASIAMVVCRRCVGRQNWDNPTRTSRIHFWGNVADGRGMHAPMMFAAWSWLQELH